MRLLLIKYFDFRIIKYSDNYSDSWQMFKAFGSISRYGMHKHIDHILFAIQSWRSDIWSVVISSTQHFNIQKLSLFQNESFRIENLKYLSLKSMFMRKTWQKFLIDFIMCQIPVTSRGSSPTMSHPISLRVETTALAP